MIDRFEDMYSLSCDNCGHEHEDTFFDFQDAVDAKKEYGWRSRRVNGSWEDWCPDCCAPASPMEDFVNG